MKTYKINEFSRLLGRSVRTLQRWDNEGILVAHRNPKNRRYYTHDQYLK
jgi:putative resolvase